VYNVSGVHQVASATGESFYLSGASADYWGWRYAPSLDTRTTTFVQGEFGGPGATEARAVGIYGGVLYGTSGPGDFGWTTVFQISSSDPMPTTSGNDPVHLAGLPTDVSPWTFVFENATSLWLAIEGDVGASGTIVHYTQPEVATTWSEESRVVMDPNYFVYSITGRYEALWDQYYLYGASQTTVYRMNATSHQLHVITTAGPNEYIRGVALPPLV
jgi:hypothetical protein